MAFVIDASITTCWLMPDEGHGRATAAFQRLDEDDAVAPALWWFEARNVIVMNERRGRIGGGAVRQRVRLLEQACRRDRSRTK